MKLTALIVGLVLAFAVHAQPSISSVTGSLTDGGTLTIGCSGCGDNGPSNVLFENLDDGGTVGNTPGTSATIGTWTSIDSGGRYHGTGRSGDRSFAPADLSADLDFRQLEKSFTATTEFFTSFCFNMLDGIMPGSVLEDITSGESSWKTAWLLHSSNDDDVVIGTIPGKRSTRNHPIYNLQGNDLDLHNADSTIEQSFFTETDYKGWRCHSLWLRAGADPDVDSGDALWTMRREGATHDVAVDTGNTLGTGTKNLSEVTNNIIFENGVNDSWQKIAYPGWWDEFIRNWDWSGSPASAHGIGTEAFVNSTTFDYTPSTARDMTDTFYVGRRIQVQDSALDIFTGDIATSTFNDPETRVTVTWDSGAPIDHSATWILSDVTNVVYDDIYFASGANAAARVVIGNASTYSASTKIDVCTVDTWSATSITCTAREGGTVLASDSLWLFVFDADNVPSTGYSLADLESGGSSGGRLLLRTGAANDDVWEMANAA